MSHCDHCDTDLSAEEQRLAVSTDLGETVCQRCQELHQREQERADEEDAVTADAEAVSEADGGQNRPGAGVRAGVARLNAHRLPDGDYVYLAYETGGWWRCTEGEVAELGAALLAGSRDAYSLWCTGTGELVDDLDHDALDEIADLPGVDEDAVGYRCQCGAWSGERCVNVGPRDRLVHVRLVREANQGSAAASNTYTYGAYAESVYVTRECAEQMRFVWEGGERTDVEDHFVRVVGPAYGGVA